MINDIPFLDLRVTNAGERQEIMEAVEKVLDHGQIVLGPEVMELEERIAAACSRKFSVGVNSGTDALYLALRALGLGQGDEVITTAFSWIATANAIRLTGATPVFADIREDLNLDPASVESLITPNTRGVLAVHYTGKICAMSELQALTERYGLWLIEDAAQAFGARLNGRPAGSFGTMGCFSMNPMKVFAALGEAGMVVTDRGDLVVRLQALRYNGTVNRETCLEPSHNGRLDTLQAAILLRRLARFKAVIEKRRELAHAYHERLAHFVRVPLEAPGEEDVYYTYTIQTDRRNELMDHLEKMRIETKIRHPILMPEQPAYCEQARGTWTRASAIIRRILCLPIHDKLTMHDIDRVSDGIRGFFARSPTS